MMSLRRAPSARRMPICRARSTTSEDDMPSEPTSTTSSMPRTVIRMMMSAPRMLRTIRSRESDSRVIDSQRSGRAARRRALAAVAKPLAASGRVRTRYVLRRPWPGWPGMITSSVAPVKKGPSRICRATTPTTESEPSPGKNSVAPTGGRPSSPASAEVISTGTGSVCAASTAVSARPADSSAPSTRGRCSSPRSDHTRRRPSAVINVSGSSQRESGGNSTQAASSTPASALISASSRA
jgi:hypothetical protein